MRLPPSIGRPRLRAVAIAAAFLIAGAAINVAVAWGLVLSRVVTPSGDGPTTVRPWPIGAPPGWAPVARSYDRAEGWGWRDEHNYADPVDPDIDGYHMMAVRVAGWPLRSLAAARLSFWYPHTSRAWARAQRYQVHINPQITHIEDIFLLTDQSEIDSGNFYLPNSALPVRPFPFPFALNTLFYAAACWGLLAGATALRRRTRRRAGACPACGYALAGLPSGAPCPECGR